MVGQFQQTEAQDMPSAREFKSPETLTSNDLMQEAEVTCGCPAAPPRRPPPPPPVPLEMLQRMFPGQDIKQEMLSRKGFCKRVKKELKDLLAKDSARAVALEQPLESPRKPASPPPPSQLPPSSSPPTRQKLGRKNQPSNPPSTKSEKDHYRKASAAKTKNKTMRVKVIDLMKNWKPLTDFTAPRPAPDDSKREKGDSYAEKALNEKEIVRQFAMEFTRPRTRSAGAVRLVAGTVSVSMTCASGVFLVFVVVSFL